MPLTINVGLSRKASKDFQSSGRSINICAELDQALLSKPDHLQEKISFLYKQAERALASPQATDTTNSNTLPRNTDRFNDRNGQHMTEAQRKAIFAIGARLELDVFDECRQVFGWHIDGLQIREASRFIDHLKDLQLKATSASAGNGGGD